MKITRMLVALLLALTLVFSLFSCGECTEHVDENGDGRCDTEGCGVPVAGAKLDETTTATYTSAVEETLAETKTATVTLDIDVTATNKAAVDSQGNVVPGEKDETVTIKADATLLIAIVDDGVNMRATMTATETLGDETENEYLEMLLVGNTMYMRDAADGKWITQVLPETDDLTAMIPESIIATVNSIIPEGFLASKIDLDEIKASINRALSEILTMNADGSVGFTVDMATPINELITAFLAIDEDDTVASLINPYLTAAGMESGIEALLDSFTALGTSVTVGGVYDLIDGALEAELGKGIAEIYTVIMSNTDIQAMLVAQGLIPAEQLPAIVALNLDEAIESYRTMTLNDLLTVVAQTTSGSQEATLTVEQLVAMAKSYVTVPLVTLLPVIPEAQAELANFKLDVLEESWYLSLTESGALNAITTADRVKVSIPSYDTDGSEEYTSAMELDATLRITINGFGTTAPTIAAPAEGEIDNGGTPADPGTDI